MTRGKLLFISLSLTTALVGCNGAIALDPVWHEARRVETEGMGSAYPFPQVAVDPNGNAVAVWNQSASVWSSRWTSSDGWGRPERVETDDAVAGYTVPRVAVDSIGNVFVAWERAWDSPSTVWSNLWTPSGGWGTPERLDTDNGLAAGTPQVAVGPDGSAMVLYLHGDVSCCKHLWSRRWTPSSGWGAAERIDTEGRSFFGSTGIPQVAWDATGDAVAVWTRVNGSTTLETDIWSNHWTPSRGWGEPQLLEAVERARSVSFHPALAVDPNGNAVAVWTRMNGPRGRESTRLELWSNRWTPGSGWGAAEIIGGGRDEDVYFPQVAIDSRGSAVAAWTQENPTPEPHRRRSSVWSNRSTLAGGWEVAERIDAEEARAGLNHLRYDDYSGRVPPEPDHIQVALDASGKALAVWMQSDGERFGIWSNRWTPSDGWGIAEPIETKDEGDARFPQVAVRPNGRAVTVWNQSDGNRTNTWSNRFE